MVKSKKEYLQAIESRYVAEVDLTVHNNQFKRTIRKEHSVKDEYCFIVPWQIQSDEGSADVLRKTEH